LQQPVHQQGDELGKESLSAACVELTVTCSTLASAREGEGLAETALGLPPVEPTVEELVRRSRSEATPADRMPRSTVGGRKAAGRNGSQALPGRLRSTHAEVAYSSNLDAMSAHRQERPEGGMSVRPFAPRAGDQSSSGRFSDSPVCRSSLHSPSKASAYPEGSRLPSVRRAETTSAGLT